MNKKTLLWLTMEFVKWICAMAYNDFKFEMVIDVIKSNKQSTSVFANVCWSLRHKRNLAYGLNKVEKPMIISFHDNNFMYQTISKTSENYVIFLVDLSCSNTIDILVEANHSKIFRQPFRWVILDRANETDVVPKELYELNILPDSEVTVVKDMGNGYVLHFVYKIGIQTKWHTEFYGTWDKINRFQRYENFQTSTALRRSNLEGYAIPICYVITDPDSKNHLVDRENGQVDTLTKVNFHTTNNLLDFLNAGRRYVFTSTWGYKVNGSLNGMSGYLVREEIEIGGTPLFLTSERLSVMDYIASPTPTLSKFVFQQPNLSYQNNLFLLSFQTAVWYSVIALIFLIFFVLFLVTFWEWRKNNEDLESREHNASILRPNITDIVILVVGAACQQGSAVELKGALGRVVILVLFLTLMFLYTSYSANIVALLQSSSSQIQTLEDLLNSRIKCSVHDTVFNRYYFSTASDPVRQAIYQKKVAPPGVMPRFITMEEGVKNIQKGLFAFHMETGVGYKYVAKYFLESQKCGLKEIQFLQAFHPWIAAKKNSPYKEMFKVGMRRIHEHGLQTRENLLLYEKQPKCTSREANFVSVSILDCYPALLVLTYGIIVSLAVLAAERIFHRRAAR